MPNIKGIDLSGGIKILSGEINTADAHYSRANIEKYLSSHTIAKTEETVNSYLSNTIKDEQIRIHIYSVSPLRCICIVADPSVVIPDNWWG